MNFKLQRRRVLPLILQSEVNECGLACLAMVAGYFGKQIDIVALRSRFRLAATGASLHHFLHTAKELDMQGRALKLELTEISMLALPVVLHWDMDHFVVLKRVRRNRFTIHDPAVGERHYQRDELSLHFTGVAIELSPLASFKQEAQKTPVSLRQLLPSARQFSTSGTHIFVLSALLQLLALLSPLYLQLVIDQGIGKGDMNLLPMLALLFFLVVFSRNAISYLRGLLTMQFANQLGFQLLGSTFDHLLRLPLRFFERREMGDIVSRFSALENIKQVLTQELITVVVDGIFSSLSLVLLFIYSPLLAGIAFRFMALHILIRLACIPAEKQRRQESLLAGARQQSRFMESIRSIITTKNYGLESQRVQDWQSLYANHLNCNYHLGHLQLGVGSLQGVLAGIDNLLTIYVGALLVGHGELTLGQLMSFIFLKQHFTSAVTASLPKLAELGLLKLELERVADISQHEPEHTGQSLALMQPDCKGAICVSKLNFRYADASPLLLNELSFSIKSGACAAITGSSGTGKSTLLKLLLGLEKPEAGEIVIDGIPLTRFGVTNFRNQVAVIMHNEGLLAGDLAYNIRLQHGVYDLDKLRNACEVAGIWELVRQLPSGFNTQVGEMGNFLSAGQVQRVLLARAFYRKPAILFLDESLSHLGNTAAKNMLEKIRTLNMTIVLVTHNPELASLADLRIELTQN